MRSELISIIDLGGSKIVCLVGEAGRGHDIEVIGYGISPTIGFQKGQVVDLKTAANSVAAAVVAAESMVDFRIGSVYMGVTGSQISYFRKSVSVPVSSTGHSITKTDVDRVMKAVSQIGVPSDRKIIHPLPIGFTVDDREGISNPIGMTGGRLGVLTNLITGVTNTLKNYNRVLEMAGLDVDSCIPVYQMLAESLVVLTPGEKKKGALLLDIGADIAQSAIFQNEWLTDADHIMVGGENISRDIASYFKITYPEAEKIKKENGHAFPGAISKETEVELSNTRVSNIEISEVIEARLRDIIEWVKEKLDAYRTESAVPETLVLSGGCSQIRGLAALMERDLEMPVRLAVSSGIRARQGLLENPGLHSALGLLAFGNIERKKGEQKGFPALVDAVKKVLDRGLL